MLIIKDYCKRERKRETKVECGRVRKSGAERDRGTVSLHIIANYKIMVMRYF